MPSSAFHCLSLMPTGDYAVALIHIYIFSDSMQPLVVV